VNAIAVGDELPGYSVTLTRQRLVMESAANRDFAPIHFDAASARASGASDAYVNTTLIETLLEALIRSWAGASARIQTLEFSMLAFNVVGDEITATGSVTAVDPTPAKVVVHLAIGIEGQGGQTVSGKASVVFPQKP
jgi:acyl dehydratase